MDYYEMTLLRKEEIENGLLALMETTPYAQITVTDLAKHLGMSRKCFYNYFPGKDACFESLANRMILECALCVETNTHHPNDYRQSYHASLSFWKEHSGFLRAVMQNDLGSAFGALCLQRVMAEEKMLIADLATADIPCDEDILLFYISGQIHVLMNWCRRDFDTPVPEMVHKFLRLLHIPLLPEN